MKRIPVQIQLFIILFSVLVIPMSIITYYTTSSMMEYSEKEIAESAMRRTKSNSELSDLVFNNVILDVLKMVKENKFNGIKHVNSYKSLNSSFDNINNAMKLLEELQEMQTKNSVVYSVMYYVDNADYVLSTNKGIVKLDDYEEMDWLDDAISRIKGAGGVWYPRYLNKNTIRERNKNIDSGGTIPVVSFVYRLNRLTTSAKGTIVVNIYEKEIQEYLNVGQSDSTASDFIMDTKGLIISNNDRDLLFTNISDKSYVKEILNTNKIAGYDYINIGDERILYTYNKMFFNDWIYVTTYSMDTLLEKSEQLSASYIGLMVFITAIGTIITVVISTKFVKPVKDLVDSMKNQLDFDVGKNKNELSFLTSAFEKLKEEENNLHNLLKARVKDTKSLAIHKLLIGELTNDYETDEINKIFPYNHYLVALVAVDDSKDYLSDTNAEDRNYHRYMLIDKFENKFPPEFKISAARYASDRVAIIINIEHYDQGKVTKTLNDILLKIKEEANVFLKRTVTIGVSGVHTSSSGIKECVYEACEALEQKLLIGKNTIIFWEPHKKESKKLVYSYNTEKKILNYLIAGDLESIKSELDEIVNQMKESEDASNDNIMLIFNQLVGATMNYLAFHNLNTNKVFKGNVNIYSIIAGLDTVDEIKSYLIEVYDSIIRYNIPKDSNEMNHFEKVMKYINEHYNEDLVFEDVAGVIGISYSYLRKLVKEETGKSLIDNVNIIRIEEVKRLLLHTDLTISEIAEAVGYRNVQSVNRFFKKYEGISPSEFKSLNR
jgi:AraC-like DNA-binding protein/methyl-accepting chemotaxis protein